MFWENRANPGVIPFIMRAPISTAVASGSWHVQLSLAVLTYIGSSIAAHEHRDTGPGSRYGANQGADSKGRKDDLPHGQDFLHWGEYFSDIRTYLLVLRLPEIVQF